MRRPPTLLVLAACLALAGPDWTISRVLAADEASAGAKSTRTRLTLRETASREVEQDTLVVVVTARATANSAREAQAQVNQRMTAAVEEAQAVEGVRRATGGYRAYQERDRNGQPRNWVAEQDLQLTSRDAVPLLELAGSLQAKGMVMNSLSYLLSREARDLLEDELTEEALSALRARTDRIAATMGLQVGSFDLLRVGGVDENAPPQPRMMMRAAVADAAAAAPPQAMPDLDIVNLSIEAEVSLLPR